MKRMVAIAQPLSAAYYWKNPSGQEKVRPGPRQKISNEDLLVEIQAEILVSVFTDKG